MVLLLAPVGSVVYLLLCSTWLGFAACLWLFGWCCVVGWFAFGGGLVWFVFGVLLVVCLCPCCCWFCFAEFACLFGRFAGVCGVCLVVLVCSD